MSIEEPTKEDMKFVGEQVKGLCNAIRNELLAIMLLLALNENDEANERMDKLVDMLDIERLKREAIQ